MIANVVKLAGLAAFVGHQGVQEQVEDLVVAVQRAFEDGTLTLVLQGTA